MALKLNGTNSVAAPAYAGADADTGLQCGTDEVNLVTGGTARLKIDSSGKVGIGSTSPEFKLMVADAGYSAVEIKSDRTSASDNIGGLHFKTVSTSVAYIQSLVDGTIKFRNTSSLTERMRITSAGYVGIGTTSPAGAFHINGTGGESNVSSQLRFSLGGTTEGIFGVASSANNIISGSAQGDTVIRNDGGNINFSVDSGTSTHMRIDSSGRLLVGTTAASGSGVGKIVSRNDVNYSSTQFEDNATLCLQNETNSNPAVLLFHSNDSGGSSGRSAIVGGNVEGVNSQLGFYGNASNLTTSTDPDVLIDSSGRVGINNTSPGSQHFNDLVIGDGSANDAGLTIHTSTSGSGSIAFSDGTSGAARFDGYLQYDHYNQSFKIYTNGGNERMRVDSSGRVLVGTSSAAKTYVSLGLQGNGASATNQATIALAKGALPSGTDQELGRIEFLDNSGNSGGTIVGISDAAWTSGSSHATNLIFSTTASGASSPTERMRIDSSGNVGIGTTSPEMDLHVKSGNNGDLKLGGSGTSATGLEITYSNSGNTSTYISQKYRSTSGSALIAIDTGTFTVHTGTSGNERMRIASNGRVGIGTSSPLARTHLDGTDNDVDNVLFLTAANLANGAGGRISFGGNYDGTNRTSWADIKGSKENATSGQYGGYLSLSTRPNGGSNTERMRIDSAGNILLGCTTVSANSDSGVKLSQSDANPWLRIVGNESTGTNFFLSGYNTNSTNNGYRFYVMFNGGIANYSGNNSNLSDEREKKNIVSLDSKWDKVKSWELKKFHYNEDADTDDLRYGVIAQQIEEHCPEVLSSWVKQSAEDAVLDDDGNVVTPAVSEITRKGVKEQQMMWMAIKALQEAQTRIEALETQHADLLARVTALEAA